MTDEWLVRVQDKTYGPVSLAILREWQGEGRLIATNELRRADEADWRIAGTIEELFPRTQPAADPVVRRRSWPEILRETLRIYRRGFIQFIGLGLLTAVPSFFLQELVPFTMPALDGSTRPSLPPISGVAVAVCALLVALWPLTAAGMQLVADAAAHKEQPRWRDLLRNSARLWTRMLLLATIVYGSFAFWLIIPFSAMLSLVAGEPSLLSFLLVLLIGTFTIYMNARLFINFLFWQQTGVLSDLGGVAALRESKRLARSRREEPPLYRPLYRGGMVASFWILILFTATAATQLPFTLVRFIGITDPSEGLALAQRMAASPPADALTLGANVTTALLHLLLRPLLIAAFVVVYYDARAGDSR